MEEIYVYIYIYATGDILFFEDVFLVEFMYFVFTHMTDELLQATTRVFVVVFVWRLSSAN